MEFKGTKGEWFLSNYDVFTRQEGETDTCLFLSLTTHRNEDIKYNSILISKAPEMLEMLKINYDYFEELAMLIPCDYWTEDFREKWAKKMTDLEKLIDEATNV